MSLRAKDRPIGIFDSGVGGLTVFKALRRAMPAERLLYFGDTARLPYGSKSPEVVRRFSLEAARFLRGFGIKLFVAACNSASALALDELRRKLDVPVLGVIEPAARAALAARGGRAVGVIGTEATVASRAYEKALRRLPGGRGVRVMARATPLLVPLVEEGWWGHAVTERVAAEYLAPLRGKVGVLILGCTHYPLIGPLLQSAVGRGVRLINSGEEAAREVVRALAERGLRRARGAGGERFYVTDGARRFRRLLGRILGGAPRRIHVVRLDG